MLIFTQKESIPRQLRKFDPSNIGPEHLAFGLKSLSELQQVHELLTVNGIENSGIHIDDSSHKEKIWLNDPSAGSRKALIKTDNEKDLVCGMSISAGFADTANYNGKVYSFCSKRCKDGFKENPVPFLSAN